MNLALLFTGIACAAFLYSLREGWLSYQHTRYLTEVWWYVLWSLVTASLIPFVHLLSILCTGRACPVDPGTLATIELLLHPVTMTFTLMAVDSVRRENVAERYITP